MAPGLSVIRLSKLRPLSGRSLTSRSPTRPETEAVVVLTTGRFADDGDLLREFADFELQIDDRFLADVEVDAGADRDLKPVFSAFNSCWPTGRERTRKLPPASVTTDRVAPVSTLLTVIVTPPTAEPLASSTRPEISADTCARSDADVSKKTASRRYFPRNALICPPPVVTRAVTEPNIYSGTAAGLRPMGAQYLPERPKTAAPARKQGLGLAELRGVNRHVDFHVAELEGIAAIQPGERVFVGKLDAINVAIIGVVNLRGNAANGGRAVAH